MTALALGLVLAAAVLHALWNYCAKLAGGGLPFVYAAGLVVCILYVPVVAVYCWFAPPSLSLAAVLWIAGSGALKTAYALFLQRAYREGDFSIVYPLSRGTGPLLAMIGAVTLLGERPTLVALAGGLVIVVGIFVLTGGASLFAWQAQRPRAAITFGALAGVFIASYTLWDSRAVQGLAIAPVIYDAGTNLTQTLLMTPAAWRVRDEVRREWREHRRYVLGVALLSPLAYVLVLSALSFTPVSYVAPAREVSIVIGALIGAKLLKEPHSLSRILAAVAIACGVIALAVG